MLFSVLKYLLVVGRIVSVQSSKQENLKLHSVAAEEFCALFPGLDILQRGILCVKEEEAMFLSPWGAVLCLLSIINLLP